jgi:hypothetical protein
MDGNYTIFLPAPNGYSLCIFHHDIRKLGEPVPILGWIVNRRVPDETNSLEWEKIPITAFENLHDNENYVTICPDGKILAMNIVFHKLKEAEQCWIGVYDNPLKAA